MPFSLLKFGLNKDYPFEQIADCRAPLISSRTMTW